MRLTVLGRWSPYPPAGGACPGYLLETGEQRVLLDCGPGVLSNLQQITSLFGLSAVVISHLHPDHVLDLFALKQALEWGRFPERAPAVRLFGPPGAFDRLPAWMDPEEQQDFRARFQFFPIRGGTAARLGPLVLRFVETAHSAPCFAVRAEAEGRALVYTADTGPSPAVETLAESADVLLAENTLPPGEEARGMGGHLSAAQAAQMAARADARRLLLTHFFAPIPDYTEEAAAAAAKEFGGQVLIARELERHEI